MPPVFEMAWQQTLLHQDPGFAAVVEGPCRHVFFFSSRRSEVWLIPLQNIEADDGTMMDWMLPFDALVPQRLEAWTAENDVTRDAQVFYATMHFTDQSVDGVTFHLRGVSKHRARRAAPAQADEDDDLAEGDFNAKV